MSKGEYVDSAHYSGDAPCAPIDDAGFIAVKPNQWIIKNIPVKLVND